MSSASLQSRIRAFEALSTSSWSSTTTTTTTAAPATSPGSPSTPTPITDPPASSPNLLESPISPTASAYRPIAPFAAPASSSRSPSPSSPTTQITHKTSLIDLKDWIIDDGPVERPSTLRHTLNAGTSKLTAVRQSRRTSPSPRKSFPSDNTTNSTTRLINFESPPKSRPPLPPRKPPQLAADHTQTQRSTSAGSENGATLHPPGRSDLLTIEHTYPPGAPKFGAARMGHAPASSISSFHSVSLSSDGSNVEVPNSDIGSKPPSFTFDVDTSSITDIDTASIAESFENVSASAISPSTAIPYDWEQAMGKPKTSPKLEPPRLPKRPIAKAPPALLPKPLARSTSASSSSTATSSKIRRPPPPPPPPYQPRSRPSSSRVSVVSTSASTSDRSSVISQATTTSLTSTSTRNSAQLGGIMKPPTLFRPTPVPSAARVRYETLFTMAVQGRRKAEKKKPKLTSPPPLAIKKSRQAAGWRGLSVDLINTPDQNPALAAEKEPVESDSDDEDMAPVGLEEKLSGRIVKYIWRNCRLDRDKLRNIWDDCDPQGTGFIDRDAFVKGMWRIDEELRRAQLARRTSALTAASSQRMPHRPLPPPRPQGSPRLLI